MLSLARFVSLVLSFILPVLVYKSFIAPQIKRRKSSTYIYSDLYVSQFWKGDWQFNQYDSTLKWFAWSFVKNLMFFFLVWCSSRFWFRFYSFRVYLFFTDFSMNFVFEDKVSFVFFLSLSLSLSIVHRCSSTCCQQEASQHQYTSRSLLERVNNCELEWFVIESIIGFVPCLSFSVSLLSIDVEFTHRSPSRLSTIALGQIYHTFHFCFSSLFEAC